MKGSITRNKQHAFFVLTGVVLLLGLWKGLSLYYNPVLVPSPSRTLDALINLAVSGELSNNMLISMKRLGVGLGLAVVIGLSFGIVAGFYSIVEWLLTPLSSILLSTPAIVFVVMAMVWFGMSSIMVVFILVLLVSPIMYTNTIEGVRSVDIKLREMAVVFRVPLRVKIRSIYLPGFIHSFLPACSICAGFSIRLTVMAELMGTSDGIGQSIAMSRSYLETDRLFAWVFVLVMMLMVLDTLVLMPLRSVSERWKGLEKKELS